MCIRDRNTTDGVIAPLFFIAIGGAPLGMAYKAVNTLDSMVGYRNEKYLYFGRIDVYKRQISARQVSCGEILCMTGIIMKSWDMIGGSGGLRRSLNWWII